MKIEHRKGRHGAFPTHNKPTIIRMIPKPVTDWTFHCEKWEGGLNAPMAQGAFKPFSFYDDKMFVDVNRFKPLLFFIATLLAVSKLLAAPARTTYQAKIIKPDGYPLEAASVNFRFTILDPSATCVLYSEDYAAVNMVDSGGLISFSLGSGVRSFPTSGPAATLSAVFDNSITSFSCQSPGIFTPVASDIRKVVMQFQDSSGWQTLPAMSINAVPYAMYAGKSDDTLKLNNKADTAFVEYSTLAGLSCAADQAIKFNGVSFSCITVGSGGGGITSVTTSGTVLITGGTASAPVISITAASMSSDGYLTSLDYAEFKAKLSASSTQIVNTLGYAPVSSSAVATQIDTAASTGAVANTLVKRDSSGNFTANDIYANAAKINYVDIYKPSTSFNIRLQAPTSLSANYTLNLPTSSGTVGQVLSTDGAGNLSWVNPSTGSVTSVSATAPLSSTGGATPTISITRATSATDGYLAGSDFITFSEKLDRASNLSDLTNVATARTNLGLGSFATASSVDLGSASATGTLATARLPNFTGDATIAAASNTIIFANSGVTSGTYTKVSVNAKGIVTSGTQLTNSDVVSALGYAPASASASTQWNTSGTTINYMNGNVGIGTASPAEKFVVNGKVILGGTSTLYTGASSYPSIAADAANASALILNGGSITNTWRIKNANGVLDFLTCADATCAGGSQYMKLSTAGLMTPGAVAFGSSMVPGVNQYIFNGNASPVDLFAEPYPFGDNAGSDLYLRAGDASTGATNKNGGTLRLASGKATGTGSSNIEFRTADSTNVTTKMFINGAGNVGIGTTSPTAKLEVSGTIKATAFEGPLMSSSTGTSGNYTINTDSDNSGSDGGVNIQTNGATVARLTASGILQAASGTASAPGISFLNDPDTGISNPAANVLALSTNGIGRLYVDANGYVGIGTSSPVSTLDVADTNGGYIRSGPGDGHLEIGSGNDISSYIDFHGNTNLATDYVGRIEYRDGEGMGLTVNGNINPSLYIQESNGYVGIGAVSPTEKLHVSGGLRVNGAASSTAVGGMFLDWNSGANVGRVIAGNASNSILTLSNVSGGAAVERMRINDVGNVGIGTTNPSAALHLKSGTSSTASLKLTSGTLLTTPQIGALEYDGNSLYFTDDTNTRRTITSTSAAGTYDSASLISNASGNITMYPNSGGGNVVVSATTASTNSSTGALIIKGGLGVAGNINAGGTIQGVSVTATSGMISPYIAGSVSASGNLTLDSTTHATKGNILLAPNGGNIGIGTTNPGGPLEVVGGNTGTAYSSGEQVVVLRNNSSAIGARGAGIRFDNGSYTGGGAQIDFINSGTANEGHLSFGTRSSGTMTEKLRIQDNGNIGVGVANPAAKLSVIGARQNTITPSNSIFQIGGDDVFLYAGAQPAGSYSVMLQAMRNSDSFSFPIALNPNGGNVGIGTANPAAKLEVQDTNAIIKSTGTGGYGSFYAVGSGTNPSYLFLGNTTSGEQGRITSLNGGALTFSNSTAANERMRIDSVGNVGIGIANPGSKLDVKGDDANNTFRTTDAGGQYRARIDQFYDFYMTNASGTDTMVIKNSGSVGIGITIPAAKFEVGNAGSPVMRVLAGTGNGVDDDNLLRLMPQNGTGEGGHLEFKGSASYQDWTIDNVTGELRIFEPGQSRDVVKTRSGITFTVNKSTTSTPDTVDALKILSSGSVGIGTSPLTKFEVAGNISSRGGEIVMQRPVTTGGWARGLHYTPDGSVNVTADGLAGIGLLGSNTTQSSIYLAFGAAPWASNNGMHILPTGKVGIGTTSPNSPLQVMGASGGSYKIGSSNRALWGGNSSGNLHVDSEGGQVYINHYDPNNVFIATGGGNVGVGTTSPSEKLHVVGNLRVQGSTDCTLGNGAGGTNCSSDARLKENIKPIPQALEKVISLKGVEFDWNAKSLSQGRHDIGVIAQDVEKVFPTAVMNDQNTGYKKVDYAVLVAPIIQALKEFYSLVIKEKEQNAFQDRQIANIEVKVQQLETDNAAKERKIQSLEQENKAIKSRLEAIEKALKTK